MHKFVPVDCFHFCTQRSFTSRIRYYFMVFNDYPFDAGIFFKILAHPVFKM